MSTRRDLLAVLVALAATPALAAAPDALAGLDRAAVRRIGEAWRQRNPKTTASQLNARLFPVGRGGDALARLRALASADFRQGAVFVHRGWRLSDTEGALFALLALEGQP